MTLRRFLGVERLLLLPRPSGGRLVSSVPKIPIPDGLKPPRYSLPRGSPEVSGAPTNDVIASLPQYKDVIREAVYLPPRDDLWKANSSVALDRIAKHSSYFDLSQLAMEHSFFHLFYDMLVTPDAPLPHVMYEDFLKVKTFSSLQDVPEKQFALEPNLLRGLLCLAAHHLIVDKGYFQTCEALFRRIDKEQSVGREVLSAWIFCCAAAGQLESALSFATFMDVNKMPLDPVVFSLMMHPGLNPTALVRRSLLFEAKGLLMQQRMHNRLAGANGTSSVAVHCMFVFYALTLNHVRKWELARMAIQRSIPLPGRTIDLFMHAFRVEKGKMCGPKTCKLVLKALLEAEEDQLGNALHVLITMRKNELLPELQGCEPARFSAEECELVLTGMRWQGRERRAETMRVVLPIADALVRHSEPAQVARALTDCTLSLETTFSSLRRQRQQQQQQLESPSAATAERDEQASSDHEEKEAEDSDIAADGLVDVAAASRGKSDDVKGELAVRHDGETSLLFQVLSELTRPTLGQKKKRRRRRASPTPTKAGGAETVALLPSVDPLDVPALVKSLSAAGDVQALQYLQHRVEEEEQLAQVAALKLPTSWISMD